MKLKIDHLFEPCDHAVRFQLSVIDDNGTTKGILNIDAWIAPEGYVVTNVNHETKDIVKKLNGDGFVNLRLETKP